MTIVSEWRWVDPKVATVQRLYRDRDAVGRIRRGEGCNASNFYPTDIYFFCGEVNRHLVRYYYVDGDPEHRKFGNVQFAEARLAELAWMDVTKTAEAWE